MPGYIGDFATSSRIDDDFTTVSADGTPTAVTSGSICVRRSGGSALAPAGAVLTASGGMYHVIIFTGSATSYFTAGADYCTFFGGGTITTTSVVGYVVNTFSIDNRMYRSNVLQVNGVSASLVDASAVADAVWDEGRSGHTSAGTYGESVTGVINTTSANVKEWLGVTPNALISGRVDANAAAVTTSADVKQWLASTPNALISGRVDSNTQAMAAGVVDASAVAADAGQELADALLDRTNAIETGLTVRQAHRLESAAAAGKLSGAATTNVLIRNAVADSKNRIDATVDSDGNRTAITTDVT